MPAAPGGPALPERPRLRADLAVVGTSFGGEPAVVVADRAAGRYVRFGEGADEVLALLDGTRTTDDLAAELGRRAGGEFPPAEARAFVEALARRGFLDGVGPTLPARRRNPLALRIPLVDPDRFAAALRPLGAALFSLPAIAGALVLGVAGAAVLGTLGAAAAVPPLDHPWTLAAFYLAASAALTAHEMGHALALRARGGVVHEAGLLLLFGMPCLYVNVSDAWLLPRRDRLVVSAAGLIVEAALFGAACLVLALAPLTGAAAVAVFAVASVCGVRSILVNLNPLIRLDGYYILSDALGIANLRPRALSALADLVRRRPPAAGAPRGVRRAGLLLYGGLALPYGVLLVGGILVLSGRWLFARGGAAGVAAWAAIAALVLWRAVSGARRALGGAREAEGR